MPLTSSCFSAAATYSRETHLSVTFQRRAKTAVVLQRNHYGAQVCEQVRALRQTSDILPQAYLFNCQGARNLAGGIDRDFCEGLVPSSGWLSMLQETVRGLSMLQETVRDSAPSQPVARPSHFKGKPPAAADPLRQ